MKILFATGNPGKLKEVTEILAGFGLEIEQLVDEYPEIQSDCLEDVVDAGLDWLWEMHKCPLIVDDTGLFIDALDGFPGVYSAYVLKTLGCEGIIKQLTGVKNRGAEFLCCAGYVDADGNKTMKLGKVRGRIIDEMRGTGGFGYDPIFVPDGQEKTFAQMSLTEKNSISHRARAFEILAEFLKDEFR